MALQPTLLLAILLLLVTGSCTRQPQEQRPVDRTKTSGVVSKASRPVPPAPDPEYYAAVDLAFSYNPSEPLNLFHEPAQHEGRELLRWQGYAGTVSGELQLPEGTAPPPVVILLPPQGVGRTDYFNRTALPFLQQGYAVLSLDLPQAGSRQQQTWTMENRAERFIEAVVDVRRGIDLLAQLETVDLTRLVLCGEELGAYVALITAAIDKRADAVICRRLTGMPAGPVDPLPLVYADPPLDDIYQPAELVTLLHGRPLLLQNAREDTAIEPAAVTALFDAAHDPKTQRWYDGPVLPLESLPDAVLWLGVQWAQRGTTP